MKKKVLIFSVAAGAGHIRASQALVAAAGNHFPQIEAIHIDVLDHVPNLFKNAYGEGYLKMVESQPALWGFFYEKTDKRGPTSKLRRFMHAVERLNTKKLVELVEREAPDHVIATHFLPAMILSKMIRDGRYANPAWVVDTDFDVHSLWVHQGLTGYFAASEEVKWRMADKGVAAETIEVTGIPIMPQFSAKLDRAECAAELGLNPAVPTVLMMSGGAGLGGIEKMAERVAAIDAPIQAVVLAGKNAALLENLKALASQRPGRVFPLPFTRTVERVMAAADFAVTKPGGLTTSECLAMGLPMIIVSPIPGQEERNEEYLLENGAALKAYDAAGLEYRVRRLLADPGKLGAMRSAAKALGRPNAARDIMAKVAGAALR